MLKENPSFIIIILLSSVYFISQFCRASLGVVAIDITNDININSEELGRLGGIFFISFALAQIPIGILLDTYNPLKIIIIMLIIIFFGSILFGISSEYYLLMIARSLQGIGCGVCLMGPLVILAKIAYPKNFSYYSGFIMGIGGLGALVATNPFYFVVQYIGWQNAFFNTAFIILFVLLTLLIFFPYKELSDIKKNKTDFNLRAFKGIIKNKNFLLMLPMSMFGYASVASILTLWGSKYLNLIQKMGGDEISYVLMFMAFFWAIGSIFFGYLEKKVNKRKYIVIFSTIINIFLLLTLSLGNSYTPKVLLVIFSLFGFFGAYTIVVLSHYRALFSKNIIGKVLTTANLFNFGGVFLVQWLTGLIIYYTKNKFNLSYDIGFSSAFLTVIFFLFLSILCYFKTDEE